MSYLDSLFALRPVDDTGHRYVNELADGVKDIIDEVGRQEQRLRIKPMHDFNLECRFTGSYIELLDGDNKRREDDYVLQLPHEAAICDVAASFADEPAVLALMALVDIESRIRCYSPRIEKLIAEATLLVADDIGQRALERKSPDTIQQKVSEMIVANDNFYLDPPF
ncbi:hypothetical protein J2Y63_004178 [Shinella sp. BE166]|uniref:hypothetical protein n=1 Tax=Shinella sp. BE166 TaxID=3373918 RepID=UPI003EBCC75B